MNFEMQRKSLDVDGHCMLAGVLKPLCLADCRKTIDSILAQDQDGVLTTREQGYGIRNLLDLWPGVVELAQLPSIREFLLQVMGPKCGVVRALFFDKPPGRSWTLPWHRDRTIAVSKPASDLTEFTNLTIKAGVHHLNAPNWFLSEMLTLRFALDPMRNENGPLVVQSGEHLPGSVPSIDTGKPITTVLGEAGDVFVMRPLLPHSSKRSAEDTQLRRRIIHLELSQRPTLPEGLAWHNFVSLDGKERPDCERPVI